MIIKLRLWSPILILLFLMLQFFILREAKAEYRVYKLGIKYNEKQKKELETLSTLDDQQFITYYRQTASQQTRIIDHWMCRGRTDQFTKYCAKPITHVPKPISQIMAKAPPQKASPSQQAAAVQVPVVLQ